MFIVRCQMCGGTLEIEDNGAFAVCAYCGTRQALPNGDNNDISSHSGGNINSSQADALRIENERRKAAEAKAQAEQNRLKAEEQRLERERIAEKNRIEKAKRSKERRGKALKVLGILMAIFAVGALIVTVIIPSIRYNSAVKDVEEKNYEEAYITFKSLYTFKDSQAQAKAL